jgi:adenylyltransferase and sulfurtransferase
VFPECPPANSCSRCADRGVLGPVPGVIGTLQALEAIKLVARVGEPLTQRLLIYSALEPRVTVVRLRARRADCAACGEAGALRVCGGPARYDYTAFTGGQAMVEAAPTVQLLPSERRLTPAELRDMLQHSGDIANPVLLLDLRSAAQFNAAHISGAINVPSNHVSAGHLP